VGGGETRAGSIPAFGTPLPEEMRSLGYPTKNNSRGTIAILKGNPDYRRVPFFPHLLRSFLPRADLPRLQDRQRHLQIVFRQDREGVENLSVEFRRGEFIREVRDDDSLVGTDRILELVAEPEVAGDQDGFFLRGEGKNFFVCLAAEAVVPDIVDLESLRSQDLRGGTRQVFVDDEYHEAQPMARIFSSDKDFAA